MLGTRPFVPLLGLAALAISLPGCGSAGGSVGRRALGGIEVTEESVGDEPTGAPRTVFVADFHLDAADYHPDEGPAGVLPGPAPGSIRERIGHRLPHPGAREDPAATAREIVDSMSAALIESLAKERIHAERLASADGVLPSDGWLVQGVFTEVDEGNRLKRAAIGFGRGATTMDVHVGVSDLAGKDPRKPFIVFGTAKDPSMLPGAAVSWNPYMAAAKFVLEKNATKKDIAKTADQIVAEILKYEQRFRDEASANRAPR
jgi:hypothetical protein